MSYAPSFAGRPYSRAPNNTYVDVERGYPQQQYPQQQYPQQNYLQQPSSYTSRHHHHHRRNHYPSSQIIGQNGYTTVLPGTQYVTTNRGYHFPSSRRSHRHTPNIIVGSTHNLGGYTTTSYSPISSTSKYRAEGRRGEPVQILSGRSHRDEWVSLSTRIRRLFGLGPKSRSGHRGTAIHVKRVDYGRGRNRVYTL